MLQQFTIAVRLAAAVAAAGIAALAGTARAQTPPPLEIADRAPSSYTVQKGDTLWGISGKFLKEPWRWPDVWRMNREQIRNPHLIYPGDVVRLEYVDGQPQLMLSRDTARETVVLSPTTRVTRARRRGDSEHSAQRYRALPDASAGHGPVRVCTTRREILRGRTDERVVRGDGDVVYVLGIDPKIGDYWYIYRPAGAIVNIAGHRGPGLRKQVPRHRARREIRRARDACASSPRPRRSWSATG